MRIGIVTVFGNPNFGSNLQSYALQTYLKQLGVCCENIVLFKSKKSQSQIRKILQSIRCVLLMIISPNKYIKYKNHKKRKEVYQKYVDQYIQAGKNIEEVIKEEMQDRPPYDKYICGSDQIWAPNQYNPVFFLSFCKDKNRKIAYAPSIGLPNIPHNLIDDYKTHLNDFLYLSIREKEGAHLVKEMINKEIPVVLDPTLLLCGKEWMNHSKNLNPIGGSYVLVYFIGNNESFRKQVEYYAKELNCKIVVLPSNRYDIEWGDVVLYDAGPQEFISLISNSKYVFTDSFHGTAFAVNLHKPFITFLRFSSGNILNQNSRVISFLSIIESSDHIYNDGLKLQEVKPINWDKVDRILKVEREKSMAYIQKAIS